MKPVTGSTVEIVRNSSRLYEGNLIHYFGVIFTKAGNLENPYHNFRHLLHVTWLCYRACEYYREILTPRDMRALLISAIFHDFNHTGVSVPDSINITRATNGVYEHILPEDVDLLPRIERTIEATKYPYTVPESELDLLGKIMRDADMSQAMSVAWIQQTVFGLARELGKTPLEILKMQKPFHEKLVFLTGWARQEFPPETVAQKIAESEDLIALLVEYLNEK